MVNQELSNDSFRTHPVGQKLNFAGGTRPKCGRIANARQTELQKAPQPTIFVNNFQAPMYFAQLVVRTSSDPNPVARAVETAIHRIDPDQAITHVTMERCFDRRQPE